MIRIFLAIAVTTASLLSATFAANTLYLWPVVGYFLAIPCRIFPFLSGNLAVNIHFGLTIGGSIAIPAAICSMIFNTGHPNWRAWLSSNAFIFAATTAAGSLLYAVPLFLNPYNFTMGLQGFPHPQSLIAISTITISGLTAGLLWYREQSRWRRQSHVSARSSLLK